MKKIVRIKKLIFSICLSILLIMSTNLILCFAGADASGTRIDGSTWVPQGQGYLGGCRVTVIDASGNLKSITDVYPRRVENCVGASSLTLLSSEDIQWQGGILRANGQTVVNQASHDDYVKNCMYKYPEKECSIANWGNYKISDNAPLFPGNYILEAQVTANEAAVKRPTLNEWAIKNKDFSNEYLALLQDIDPSMTKEWLTTGVTVGGEETRPVVFFQPLVLMLKETDYGWKDPYTGTGINPGKIKANTAENSHGFVANPTLYVVTDNDYQVDASFRPMVLNSDGSVFATDEKLEVTSGQIVTPVSGNSAHMQAIVDKYVGPNKLIKTYILNNTTYAGIGVVNGWPGDDSSGGGGSGGGGGVPSNKADIIIKSQNVILYEDELSYVYSNVKFSIVKQIKILI